MTGKNNHQRCSQKHLTSLISSSIQKAKMRAILRGCTEGADMYRENRGLPARQAGQIRCTRDGEPLQEEGKKYKSLHKVIHHLARYVYQAGPRSNPSLQAIACKWQDSRHLSSYKHSAILAIRLAPWQKTSKCWTKAKPEQDTSPDSAHHSIHQMKGSAKSHPESSKQIYPKKGPTNICASIGGKAQK